MKKKKWYHATTRLMGLLEIQLANEVYPSFPIKNGGFNLDTIVIGKNGILKRYVDEDQLQEFEKLVRNNNYQKLLKDFKDYEKRIIPSLKELIKKPLTNRVRFMKIFRQLWVHEITCFFIGLYCEDKKSLKLISSLRGTKSAQHIATSDFLPKLLNEISTKLKIKAELLKYAMPEEIISLKLSPIILALRQKRYVLKLIKGKLYLLTGEKAQSFAKIFKKGAKEAIDSTTTEFKGMSAYPGKISGKVTVVLHDSDLSNVCDGDILVSPMTRTSFIYAMKKAGAFITDEGGVTCHAAIVARELKKPCIVGTRIASKILKTGMKITVDANSGLINII